MGAQPPANSTLTRPTFNTRAPADNTAAVITLAATTGVVHVVDWITCCYDATPAADKSLLVSIGGATIYELDIIAAGPLHLDFGGCPFEGAAGEAIVITLEAAGAACGGQVNCNSR